MARSPKGKYKGLRWLDTLIGTLSESFKLRRPLSTDAQTHTAWVMYEQRPPYRFDRKSMTGCKLACFFQIAFTFGRMSNSFVVTFALRRNSKASRRFFVQLSVRTLDKARPNLEARKLKIHMGVLCETMLTNDKEWETTLTLTIEKPLVRPMGPAG